MPTTSRGSGRSNNALIVVVIPAPQPSYIERIYETTCPRPVAQVFEHSSAQASGHPLGQHVRTRVHAVDPRVLAEWVSARLDRKSTRLNSSHVSISYAVFCLKKKKHRE